MNQKFRTKKTFFFRKTLWQIERLMVKAWPFSRPFNPWKRQKLFFWFSHCSSKNRSSHPEVFLGKSVLRICGKFTGEYACWSNFIEITLRYGCSPVNLLRIFRISFFKNTSGWLLLKKPVLINFEKFTGKHLCGVKPELEDYNLVKNTLYHVYHIQVCWEHYSDHFRREHSHFN